MNRISKQCLLRMAKFEIRKSRDRQFYFVLVAGNGEPMFTSETYTRRDNAIRAVDRLRIITSSAKLDDLS